MSNHKVSKILLFTALFIIAFLERTVFHFGPNIEFVTTALVLSSYYLGKKESLALTFLIMFTTDLIIGNSNILIFTWSGFLIPAFLTSSVFKKIRFEKIKNILLTTVVGLTANIFFYFWTNFGVWLLDSTGMYPKSAFGLLLSFVNGLPFLKNQMIGTAIFMPLTFLAIETILTLKKNNNLNYSNKSLGVTN